MSLFIGLFIGGFVGLVLWVMYPLIVPRPDWYDAPLGSVSDETARYYHYVNTCERD